MGRCGCCSCLTDTVKSHGPETVMCGGVFVMVIALALLVTLGILFIGPYAHHRLFRETHCTVLNSTVTQSDIYCDCSDTETWYDSEGERHEITRYCESSYPCLLIHVSYKDAHGEPVAMATLYKDSRTLLHHSVQCSYRPYCSEFRRTNVRNVDQFRGRWGRKGMRYPCFYNPSRNDEVIIWKVTSTVVIHCILWPSLLAVAGLAAIIVACIVKRRN